MRISPSLTKEIEVMARYLTEAEEELLSIVTNLYQETGTMPTNKEIEQKLTEKRKRNNVPNPEVSRSFVSQYLSKLDEKGHLVYKDGRVKSINMQTALDIKYILDRLEWLTGKYEEGKFNKEDFERIKKVLTKDMPD